MMNKIFTISASDARADLYNLIRSAGKGAKAYEIVLRGAEPAILMSKDELESWMETLDVMSSPAEVEAIREGREEHGGIELDELMKKLDYKSDKYEADIQKTSRKRVGKVAKKRTG